MLLVKRANGIHFGLFRRNTIDLALLQKGQIKLSEQEQIVGYVGNLGQEYILDLADLQILTSTSSVDYTDATTIALCCNVELAAVHQLLDFGFLISENEEFSNPIDAKIVSMWDSSALFYHQRSKWEGRDAELPATVDDSDETELASEDFFIDLAKRFGDAPPQFLARVEPVSRIQLELCSYESDLTKTLNLRKTTRLFNQREPLQSTILSTILYYVFGCHGFKHLADDMIALKKTSPSGGALHPIEVYPLVINVSGLASGIYHYHVGDHALEPMKKYSKKKARELARVFTAGQAYYASAQVVLLYTARFERNFWKYRRNQKAYKVIQMDLGHLSQTLYLLSAELGIGAFFTAACNDVEIEIELGIDGLREGALGVGGIGIPSINADAMAFNPLPYIPRTTKL